MAEKKRALLWVIISLLLLLSVLVLLNPRLQAQSFVFCYGSTIEESLRAGSGLPAGLPVKSFNLWEGEHLMVEFLLTARGLVPSSRYYGCYYSPDDVPLAFQNAAVPLVPAGEDCWTWQGEGDNHGQTERIRENRYYFEAAF